MAVASYDHRRAVFGGLTDFFRVVDLATESSLPVPIAGKSRVMAWDDDRFLVVEDLFSWSPIQVVALYSFAEPSIPAAEIRIVGSEVSSVWGESVWGNGRRVVPLWYPQVLVTGTAPRVAELTVRHVATRSKQPDEIALMAPVVTDRSVALYQARGLSCAVAIVDALTNELVADVRLPSGPQVVVGDGQRWWIGHHRSPERSLLAVSPPPPDPTVMLGGAGSARRLRFSLRRAV